jgi:hypothetical protein
MFWRDFIRSHTEVLAAVDFFTAEVWTAGGLMTHYVLTFMRVTSREAYIALPGLPIPRFWVDATTGAERDPG